MRRCLRILLAVLSSVAAAAGAQTKKAAVTPPSPGYFASHADDAVHWRRFAPPTFEDAKRQGKPLFVSIGYGGCRWCDVIQRESFTNAEVAAVLNTRFIPVLVDRDEMPEVAAVYGEFVRAAEGNAGYPFNVIIAPDLWPVEGKSYLDPASLQREATAAANRWARESSAMQQEGAAILGRARMPVAAPAPAALERAGDFLAGQLAQTFDREKGGFGGAPKTLPPVAIDFLLRRASRGDDRSRDMAATTIRGIARGGICDRVGGGFHHFTLDAEWHIPDFEKTLNDQTLMAIALTESWQINHKAEDQKLARRTLGFVLRDLRSTSGALYSGEGSESLVPLGGPRLAYGAFYTWSLGEVRKILGPKAADPVVSLFGLTEAGNVPADLDPRGDLKGRNVLFSQDREFEVKGRFGLTADQFEQALDSALDRLQLVRSKRPPPGLDADVITAWNGLALSALARAGAAFDDDHLMYAAGEVARFIESQRYDPRSKKLLRSPGVEALADDYAFVVQGFLDLYEASGQPRWLALALELQRLQDDRLWSGTALRYVDTSMLPEGIRGLVRERDMDVPSANSVSAMNLVRIETITGEAAARAKSEAIFRSFAFAIRSAPQDYASLISAQEASGLPPRVVVIGGDSLKPETRALWKVVRESFSPRRALVVIGSDAERQRLATIVPAVKDLKIGKDATAWVCDAKGCSSGFTDPAKLAGVVSSDH